MKTIAFLLLSTLTGAAWSQLEQPDPSAVGSYVLRVGSYVAPGFQGAGSVWDFSGLQPQGSPISQVAAPVGMHPLSKSFGGATWWINQGGVDLFYSWSGAAAYHGGIQGAMVVAYSDPEVYHPFPFALGATHEDVFACNYGAGGVSVARSGSVASACVGQGTLTLPSGMVYENVYRVDMSESILDHTSMGDYEILLDGSYFYHADHAFPLLGLVQSTTIDDMAGGGEPVVTEQAYSYWVGEFLLGTEPNGFGEGEGTSHGLRGVVVPNPVAAGGRVSVVWPWGGAPTELEVCQVSGAVVHRQRVPFGVTSVGWDTGDWAPGVYLVRGVDTGEVLRWVVE